MTDGLIISLSFGLDILIQTLYSIKADFSRKDLSGLARSIAVGIFISLVVVNVAIKNGDQISGGDYIIGIYVFYAGCCIGFAYYFLKRLLRPINEASIIAINSIILYYLIAYLGVGDGITQVVFCDRVDIVETAQS